MAEYSKCSHGISEAIEHVFDLIRTSSISKVMPTTVKAPELPVRAILNITAFTSKFKALQMAEIALE